jgi:hypothetical protein
MASSIYNFFNFLEKKAGKILPAEKAMKLKLRHAKELVTDKEIQSLSPENKVLYYPELVKGRELIWNDDYSTPQGTVSLPEGFTVNGTLYVYHLEKTPVNIKARSVNWSVSSDLYPKSFTGATFEDFRASKECNELPERIQVTNLLDISRSNIKTLPEGLNTKKIEAGGSKLQSLPSKLTCNFLDIRRTGIKEIPEGVVVKDKLTVNAIPEKYPKHIEDVISVGGYKTIKQVKTYEALPIISIKVGKKVKKGKGLEVPLAELSGEKFTEFVDMYKSYTTADNYRARIKSLVEGASKFFKAKFSTVYFFYKMTETGFEASYFIYGKDDKNREILISPDAAISAEGQTSIKSFSYAWSPTEREVKNAMVKLFPKSHEGEKPVKAVNIRTLMTGPKAKRVFWEIGRKQRGGYGIQGQAKDLIPSLSGASQDNMTRYAENNGITWGDMMVFDNNDAINIIARSKEQTEDGNYVYFDKYGYGQGGGSTVFKGPDYTVL